jgi:hypothetical protein
MKSGTDLKSELAKQYRFQQQTQNQGKEKKNISMDKRGNGP